MEPEVALGQEVSIEDKPAWESLMPTAGQVLEVHMNSTSLDVLHDSWAGFFIDRVELHEGGSVSLHVRLIGAEDQTIANALGKFTDSGRLSIHLCRSRPCAEVMQEQHVQLHVTRVRLFSFPEYINSADYVSAGQKKLSKGWHRYLEKKQKDDVESRTKSTPGRGHGRGRGGLPARGSKPNPSKAPGDGLGQDRETPEISESMKRKLKEKLREVKDRVVPKNANKGAESHSSADEDSETGLEDDYSESVLEPPKLTGGTELVPQPPALEDLIRDWRPRTSREVDSEEEEEEKEEREGGGGYKRHFFKQFERPAGSTCRAGHADKESRQEAPQEEEEQREHSEEVIRCVDHDPYQVNEEEEEEEPETSYQRRRCDRKLQRYFFKQFGVRRGRGNFFRRSRNSNEKTKPGSSRQCTSTIDRSREGPIATVGDHGGRGHGEQFDKRSESDDLLHVATASTLPGISARDEGTSPSISMY